METRDMSNEQLDALQSGMDTRRLSDSAIEMSDQQTGASDSQLVQFAVAVEAEMSDSLSPWGEIGLSRGEFFSAIEEMEMAAGLVPPVRALCTVPCATSTSIPLASASALPSGTHAATSVALPAVAVAVAVQQAPTGFRRNELSAFANSLRHLELVPLQYVLYSDIVQFLQSFESHYLLILQEHLRQLRGLKVWLHLHVLYESAKEPSKAPFTATLKSTAGVLTISFQIQDFVLDQFIQIINANEKYIREQSELRLREVLSAEVNISSFNPLAGGVYSELTRYLKQKHALVNPINTDNRCVSYALLAGLKPARSHANRPSKYNRYFAQTGLDKIRYPVEPDRIPELENLLKVRINVFSFYDSEGRARYAKYVSPLAYEKEVNLLYWNTHYALIKDFGRFMFDLTKNRNKKWFCMKCLNHFSTEERLLRHKPTCSKENCAAMIYKMPPAGATLQFKNQRFQVKFPFALMADTECITATPSNGPTGAYQEHNPIAAGVTVITTVPELQGKFPYESFCGEKANFWLMNRLIALEKQIMDFLLDEKRMKFSEQDRAKFEAALFCHICGGLFDRSKAREKVRDHDHLTGEFRGAAHMHCNLQMRKTFKIPIFMHNFRGYDSHVLVQALALFPGRKVRVIGQGLEKYLILEWGDHLVFKDSLQFLNASLESLVAALRSSQSDKFLLLRSEFKQHSSEQIELLLRKGVFPYDHLDRKERLDELQLPSRDQFFNRLRNAECTVDEYTHAENVLL